MLRVCLCQDLPSARLLVNSNNTCGFLQAPHIGEYTLSTQQSTIAHSTPVAGELDSDSLERYSHLYMFMRALKSCSSSTSSFCALAM